MGGVAYHSGVPTTSYVLELAFTRDNDRRLQVRPAHREYLGRLHEEGRLETAGPWADDTGALLVYRVADRAELDAILADDPYHREGVVEVASLREWRPLF
jgi:uncharacterized protein YciI